MGIRADVKEERMLLEQENRHRGGGKRNNKKKLLEKCHNETVDTKIKERKDWCIFKDSMVYWDNSLYNRALLVKAPLSLALSFPLNSSYLQRQQCAVWNTLTHMA